MSGSIILNPRGKIQARTHDAFSRELTTVLERQPCVVTLDMKLVTAVDSPGITLILGAYRSMNDKGASLRLTGLNDRLRGILEKTEIGGMIQAD